MQIMLMHGLLFWSALAVTLGADQMPVTNVTKATCPAPVVAAQSIQHDDNLLLGDDVTVTCEAPGETSDVQSLTLNCGQDYNGTESSINGTETGDGGTVRVETSGRTVSLFIGDIGPSYNSIECRCRAVYLTNCSGESNILQLHLLKDLKQETSDSDFPTAAVVFGVLGAIFVIELLLVGICYLCRRRRSKKASQKYHDKHHDKHYQPEQPTGTRKEKLDVQPKSSELALQGHQNLGFDNTEALIKDEAVSLSDPNNVHLDSQDQEKINLEMSGRECVNVASTEPTSYDLADDEVQNVAPRNSNYEDINMPTLHVESDTQDDPLYSSPIDDSTYQPAYVSVKL